MSDDLPRITDDSSWVDLAECDQALVLGTLESIASDCLVVRFSDWSQLLIAADGAEKLAPMLNEPIQIEVERTADGILASADDISNAIVGFGTI
ncbi:hypothetical protein [Sphingosinicella sp. BN140058]|uniref:hypothetical protein n=1 Tax=Sphingosinicella sp. BN140058 TaxID=1892855 RepID=UPI0010114D69|nr:hypothetical protein [Sphingosinicella sp. BN140058]QAY80309.1 hypothetical protein ETR14_27075 [Sphingosinicella sp. BN140058]